MVRRTVRIGQISDAFIFDDADYTDGIETDAPIKAGTPVDPTHVLRLQDVTIAYPVGAVFLSVVSTNPSILLGFGTWVRIAEGQMLVGYKSGDADFGTVEGTGGSKTASHTNNHSGGTVLAGGGHSHSIDGAHTHDVHTRVEDKDLSTIAVGTDDILTGPVTHSSDGGHTHDAIADHGHGFTQPDAHSDHNILNPFFTIYAWKRTA
jgi:hypothetical protein